MTEEEMKRFLNEPIDGKKQFKYSTPFYIDDIEYVPYEQSSGRNGQVNTKRAAA
jgi:hypothetical protein